MKELEPHPLADVTAGVLRGAANPMTWRAFGTILWVAKWALLILPGELIDTLLYVKRGRKHTSLVSALVITVVLVSLASEFQSLAGDMAFGLAMLFAFMWLADKVWAHQRVRAGSEEHDLSGGVFILHRLGRFGEWSVLLALIPLGLALAITPPGHIVGLALALGGLGVVVSRSEGSRAVQRQLDERRDSRITQTLLARASEPAQEEEFQDVKIH